MKFATPETEEVSINLTPLIDIVFLLLIFFMVSTTFQRETELEIALPEASATARPQQAVSAVVLEIDSGGVYRLAPSRTGDHPNSLRSAPTDCRRLLEEFPENMKRRR